MFEDVRRTRSEALRVQAVASEARLVGRALREVVNMHFDIACHQLDKAMRALQNSRRLPSARTDFDCGAWSELRRLQVAAPEARLVRAALREVRCTYLAVAREQIAFAKAVLAASGA